MPAEDADKHHVERLLAADRIDSQCTALAGVADLLEASGHEAASAYIRRALDIITHSLDELVRSSSRAA